MLDSSWLDVRRCSNGNSIKVSVNGEDLILDPRSTSRFMTSWNGVILKLDGARNTGQVLSEVLLWPEIAGEDLEFFVPLIGCGLTKTGEFWLAQEEFDPDDVSDLSQADRESIEQDLDQILEKYGIWDVYTNQCNGFGNWVLVDGCPKIYDWGLNPHWDQTTDLHQRGYTVPRLELAS